MDNQDIEETAGVKVTENTVRDPEKISSLIKFKDLFIPPDKTEMALNKCFEDAEKEKNQKPPS